MANGRIDENGLPLYAPGDFDYVRVVDRSTGASRNALVPEVTAAARAISEALDGLVADAREDIDVIIRDLGYLAPVAYAPGLNVNDIKFTVSYNGDVYAPKPELVPFTTGAWDPDQWNVIQGDINLRSDLADPTGGAVLVARSVVAVDSIADLRAMPAPSRRQDLRYSVKGYYAGAGQGGGEFFWDPASTAPDDGGIVIAPAGAATGRFVRTNSKRTLFSQWGARGGQLCDDALDRAWTGVPEGGELVIDAPVNGLPYRLDRARPPRTKAMTVTGERGHLFRLEDQSSIFHDTAETVNRSLFPFAASNCSCEGVVLDMNYKNNWTTVGGVRTHVRSENRVNGINFGVSTSSPVVSGVRAVGNKVSNIIWLGISFDGGMTDLDGEYSYTDALGIDGFEISGNEVSQGGAGVIYIGAGVRNGTVHGNIGTNCFVTYIHLYRQAIGIDVYGNRLLVKSGGLAGADWYTQGGVPARQGIRLGHGASAPGTVHDVRVFNNNLVVRDSTLAEDQGHGLIRVQAGCRNVDVWDNYCAPGVMIYGMQFESPGVGFRARSNTVDCRDQTQYGIRYFGSTENAELLDNRVLRAKTNPLLIAACENLRIIGTRVQKGTTTGAVINAASSAVNNYSEGTILDGFAWTEFASTAAAIQNNHFNETRSETKRVFGEAFVRFPIDGAFGFIRIDMASLVSSVAGDLQVRFLGSGGAPISALVRSHASRYIASTDDVDSVSRDLAGDFAKIGTIQTVSAQAASGFIEVKVQGRVTGKAFVERDLGTNAESFDGFFSVNSAAVTAIEVYASSGTISGVFNAKYSTLRS